MAIAAAVGTQRTDGTRRQWDASFHGECRRSLERLRATHAAQLARINGEDLQGSDADDELVVRSQATSRHSLVREIDGAIQRLEDGTYGRCEDCGTGIPPGRLRTIPYTRRCIACQRDRSS